MVRDKTDFTSDVITDDKYVITDDRQKAYRSLMTLDHTTNTIAVHVPVHPALTVQTARPETRSVSTRSPVSLIDVGYEAIVLWGAHGGPVLAAVFGFACLSAVAQSFSLLTGVTPTANPWLYICLVALGFPLYALSQGTIAWFGLCGDGGTTYPSLKTAVRAALSRWRPLLFGFLTHAVLTFISALGFASLLFSSRLQMYTNPNDEVQVLTSRSIDAVALGPQHPFFTLLEPARHVMALLPIDQELPVYQPYFEFARFDSMYAPPPPSPRLGNWVMLASLALLIAAVTLLRFRVIAAMRTTPSAKRVRWGVFAPLIQSVQLVVHDFRPVTTSTWGLRLAASLIQIIFVILPMVHADLVALPQLSPLLVTPWMVFLCRLAGCGAGAMVSAILTAFCTLYDARLFIALQHTDTSR